MTPHSPESAWADTLLKDLDAMALQLTRTLNPWPVPDRVLQPEAFGYLPGSIATLAIQRAIDACSEAGGGRVLLAQGDYVSGTLDLRSGVMLEIAEGARLLGSTDLNDYPQRVAKRLTLMDTHMQMHQSLIFAEGCERVGICGKGTIDGRGTQDNFPGLQTQGSTPGRLFVIRIIDCKQVTIRDVSMLDSSCWMQNYLNCEDLIIDGIYVENQANFNNDGIDIDGCRRVIVRNCVVNAEDDGLCFKAASLQLAENILVENCQFFSSCNALKFGTDSQADFRNVLVRNVTLGGPAAEMRARHRRKSDSGISWEMVDGATVERIAVLNARIVRSESPLFLRLGDRGRGLPGAPHPAPGNLRQIVFTNISGDDNGSRGSFFVGISDKAIEDVLLRDIDLTMTPASEAPLEEKDLDEQRDGYPDAHMYSTTQPMPAYGLWTRHIKNLRLERVSFKLSGTDTRPMLLTHSDSDVTLSD